jgi:hypothetical protein
VLQGIVRGIWSEATKRGSYAIKFRIRVLRGKRKAVADMYEPAQEDITGMEKGREETDLRLSHIQHTSRRTRCNEHAPNARHWQRHGTQESKTV